RSHDLHFLPVVAEFLAAIQASDVGARAPSLWIATGTSAHRNRKTIAIVPAAKHGVHQLRKHRITSTELKAIKLAHPIRLTVKTSSNNLDSISTEKVLGP